MSEANALVEGLTSRMCRWIESNCKLRVLRMAAEYVMDDRNQVWFTHCAELVTGPKAPRWKPNSGNEQRISGVPSIERKLQKPHRVRIQPSKDGTQLCAGDYCHDDVVILSSDDTELSKFSHTQPLNLES